MIDLEPGVEVIDEDSILKVAERGLAKEIGVDFAKRMGASTIAHAINYAVGYIFKLNTEMVETIDVTPRE